MLARASEQRRPEVHAVQDFQDTDDAMMAYAWVMGKTLDPLGKKPQLSDVPRDYLLVLGMKATTLIAYKLAK